MTTFSHSELLRSKIGFAKPRMDDVARRFWLRDDVDRLYPEFLFLVHSMIRASVPLMEAAEAEARRLGDADPVAAPLADYFAVHRHEEEGHDDWVLDDLEVLGVSREEVRRRVPSTTVAELVGAHYYWLRHVHPVALLGYLAVLEGNPPKVDELEDIQRRTGLPRDAFRTLVKHAHLDPRHRDDLNDLIDRLPMSREHQALVALSAFHTIERVSRAFEEILQAHAA